jgi:hypothetical protein
VKSAKSTIFFESAPDGPIFAALTNVVIGEIKLGVPRDWADRERVDLFATRIEKPDSRRTKEC